MTLSKVWLVNITFVIGFTLLAGIVWDLKTGQSLTETCQLIGQGKSLQAWEQQTHPQWLYSHDGRAEKNIGLSCALTGNAMLNDDLLLPPVPGTKLELRTTRYHVLPTRHRLALPVIND